MAKQCSSLSNITLMANFLSASPSVKRLEIIVCKTSASTNVSNRLSLHHKDNYIGMQKAIIGCCGLADCEGQKVRGL